MSETYTSFDHVPQGKPDAILGVKLKYNADKSDKKVNLGIGAYRDSQGKPMILNVVRKAQEMVVNDPNATKEYLTQLGDPNFLKATREFIFDANSAAVKDERIVTAQSLSGTGALRIAGDFLARFRPCVVYVPSPTWGNHMNIFGNGSGLEVRKYKYMDPKTLGLDLNGMLNDLKNAPSGSVVILHACAHNPSGVDPTKDEWKKILQVITEKKLLPFFDSAYQGYASGDINDDAYAIRLFADSGIEVMVAQSYSKNLGLYGERIGSINIVCSSKKVAEAVTSQIKIIIRGNYSNPPRHGAAIVAKVLTTPELRKEWVVELKQMVDRISAMRNALVNELETSYNIKSFAPCKKQIGMFILTPLTPKMVSVLADKYSIYMTSVGNNGRISLSGLNNGNVKYVAESISKVMQEAKL